MPGKRGTPEERFWRHVDKGGPDECWPWTASCSKGHGLFQYAAGRSTGSHRYSYALAFGPIPEGLDVDHMCHNEDDTCFGGQTCAHRRCVNPGHLKVATRRENLLRGNTAPAENVVKTHCPNDHPYAGDNLYVWRNMRGCKTCRRATNRKWWAQSRKVAA